ncbi:hypothetical protein BBJ29_009058 [Phytophthora kernoviae]|uniref:Aquaporin n=1 Tax=Phytophthora kernoviae TaxID=325452 RepID=A0A3F2RWH0_9STRA|nr:hypothetical protein BBJ29_009058 [Phytophthora kernoviae]RLN64751.1 hypothetical protein BBP00_00003277 [Phytophthora kernoviae]
MLLSSLTSFRPLALECASEFIGTFVLVFLGTASIATAAYTTSDISDVASQQVALGWGFAAALATFIAAPASSAHLNPAVTLALALSPQARSGFPKRKIPAYMLFQLLGATLAGLAVFVMFGPAIERFENRLKLTSDEAAAAWMRHQQLEGDAILEQLEKSQTLLRLNAGTRYQFCQIQEYV